MPKFYSAADYFKHDPIALRRCILYEFVQGKPVDTAYTEFCEKTPVFSRAQIIEKEEFERLFDQFNQGKFDDNKEPMTDMKEILRNDKKALRACILYESLERQNYQKVSHGGFILPFIRDDWINSFKKYMHFREVLGKDVMDYKEFRFWMHRFSRREFDLEYEGTENFEETDVDFAKFDKYLEMLDRLSDIFKDPMILRYCLLFEFLKHRPIEEVFENFCRKVGENVIDFDTFQYWFNQFEQGIFDEKRGPVADMRDILRSDQRALRVCILYVSLNYCWSRESMVGTRVLRNLMPDRNFRIYSFFSKVMGRNVMKYEEFVYWKTRFSDGKFDFDHERSEKARELTDMPIDIMKNLVQYLSIHDRIKVRRTSKALHAFIDSQPLFLEKISFSPESMFYWKIEVCSSSTKTDCIIYTDNQQNEYPIKPEYGVRVVDREDYQNCAMEHLKLILQTPNLHSEHLDIKTDEFSLYDYMDLIGAVPTQNDLLDGLESVIDPSAKPRIKSIHIKSTVLEPVVKFLSYLEPGYLESISLNCEYTHGTGLSKMLELEQFKQAKELNVNSMPFAGSVRDLLHLDSFRVDITAFSTEDFRILREVAFKSSTFKYCFLSVKGQFDFDRIRRELDDSSVPGIRQNEFHHLIPNTEDRFEITIFKSGICVYKNKDYREKDRREMEMRSNFHQLHF